MSSSRNGLVQDDFGGFIDDDMSGGMGSSASVDIDTSNNIAGMEREIYIDGKMHLTKKGKKLVKDKEKGKKKSNGYGSDVLGLFRVFWATRQTEDIDKVRNPDHYVKVTLRELAIYSIFLIIICLIAFGMITSDSYVMAGVMDGAFISSPNDLRPFQTFRSVSKMSEIWTYLEGPFLDNLYGVWYNDGVDGALPASESIKEYVGNENKVLGVARLRQIRVTNSSCTIPDDFKQEIKQCYADWAPGVEDKMPAPTWPYYTMNETNNTAWRYQTEAELDGSSHKGLMNMYGGGGFVAPFDKDIEVSRAMIARLKRYLWIDRATRAIFIDFTVYNGNINLFCQVRLLFEMPATGGVVPTFTLRPVKLIRYVTAFDYFIMVCEFIFCGFIAYYIVEEAIEIHKHKFSYFTSMWNILDVIIVCISIVCISFNVYRHVSVARLLQKLLSNDNQYVDFDFLCYWQVQFNSAIAGLVFIAWIKVFKYLSFNTTMTQLQLTLSRCAKDVAGFAIMFFIVFLAYAQLGYLVFGTQVHDFSTFEYAIYSLFRIIMGDFDFEALETANRVLGPIFFLTYVFFVFFVLLNMFIAIINDTYGEIKNEVQNQKSEIELASFFKKGYARLLEKLDLKSKQIVEIKKAITSADLSGDKVIEFNDFRNNLRQKGYTDTEIETLFNMYDGDGDRCLGIEEQSAMLKELSQEDADLKAAYMALEQQKQAAEEAEADRKRKRTDGVMFDDYKFLSGRIDNMDNAINAIVNKVDMVLGKLEKAQKARAANRAASGRGRGSGNNSGGSSSNNSKHHASISGSSQSSSNA